MFSTDLDVINFDAYEYFQGLSLYPAELSSFLGKGGVLSWGIVPGSRPTATSTRILCWPRWMIAWNSLPPRAWTADALYRQALLTPSCGLGTESVEKRTA